MHVYFVRHGQTGLNSAHRHQSPNTPLSVEGREQMISRAGILRDINPDLLVTSEYTRARESARIIGLHTGLTPVTNGLFYEIERPSTLYHKSIFSIETVWYVLLSVLRRKNTVWRYADAENMHDIIERAHNALAYIESLRDTHKSVVIVSHTVFINIMITCMCKNTSLSILSLVHTFFRVGLMKNASVIHVEYGGNGASHMCNWRIVKDVV